MNEQQLRDLLARVHERLDKAGSIDQDSRALLATLTREIERTVGSGPAGSTTKAAEHVPRLEAFAVQLEADHPALAQVLRQLVNLLGGAGI